ncbi:MAG: hypothetical protein A2004_03760 [Spirochaetes bacterium GWC1_61_12]|nr:MAG: hypothetical protein A2004_03760 [Spirochaetes bacterium GWC1_61_12]OHD60726.1 MAG: hypothetical protein A2Y32_07615 [Spirochaetes bacterium GWF1_60_12]HBO41016.1 hypothetical protein [Spirochaetaceae bacterium]
MKKFIVGLLMLGVIGSMAVAQTNFVSATSGNYVAWVDGTQAEADELALRMSRLFELYNQYFMFDESSLSVPLNVRGFRDITAFNVYLQRVIGTTKDDFVYLHYPTAERSELVIFLKDDPAEFGASLAHQGFVQFLKAFVPNPPLWMREGFAVFFEQAAWDPLERLYTYHENQSWLETVKLLAAESKLFPVRTLMGLSSDEARASLDIFYPQAWALVAFLMDTDGRYNRFLWDAIAMLRSEAGQGDAQAAVLAFYERWYSGGAIDGDFVTHINGQLTFAEYVTRGVEAYGANKLDEARDLFFSALGKNDANYIPYYYIGLIAYADNDFPTADLYYKAALRLGSDQAITNYALGINAFAARNYDEARAYLVEASRLDPARYQVKVADLLNRLSDEVETNSTPVPATTTPATTGSGS